MVKWIIEISKKNTEEKSNEIVRYIQIDENETCDPKNNTYNYKNCSTKISNKYKDKEGEAQLAYLTFLLQIPFYALFQPTLSQCGMVQSRVLGQQLEKKKLKSDAIVCAATVPAMMTAYLTALYAKLPDPVLIYIVPYLNEKESEEAKKAFAGSNLHDFANYGISPTVIGEVGKTIEDWFKNAKIYDQNNTSTSSAEPIQSSATPPQFDYTYYQDGGDELRESAAATTFFEWFDKTPLKDKTDVWVFSYDTPIKDLRKQVLAGLIDDNTNPNFWDANTSVFQHKRQGTILQPIFPPDAPPKLTRPFPEELAECGLIYYPNSEGENTIIRQKKNYLMPMDKTTAENDMLALLDSSGLRGQIAHITHGENLADIKKRNDYAGDMENKLNMVKKLRDKIPPLPSEEEIKNKMPSDLTIAEQTEFITNYQTTYEAEKNNIEEWITYFTEKIEEMKSGTDKTIDSLLMQEIIEIEEQIMNITKKYGDNKIAANDTKAQLEKTITDVLSEENYKKLKELHDIIRGFKRGEENRAANMALFEKQKTTTNTIDGLEKEIKGINEKRVSDSVLEGYKTDPRFLGRIKGGGGRSSSRKKRNRKSKKSIRKKQAQVKKGGKSKKLKKKKGRKYTRRRARNL
jgi:hypothetical protein